MTEDTKVAQQEWSDQEVVGEGDRLVGSVLDGRFRIVAPLGAGGMGQVYRGQQLSVERDVAVKILHGALAAKEEFRRRFLREARVISGFSHPNIVQPIDFGRDADLDVLYFVMEYVQGLGLHQLVSGQRLSPRLAFEIGYQVAGALAEAHNQGIVHRDLKAENLVLTSVADGSLQVKVLDFGIAFPHEDGLELTATGQVYGTPSYMAPEQASDGEIDGRTDLYALGIVLFEALTGQLPVEGSSSMEVMVAQIEEGPPPLEEVLAPEEAPEAVFELVNGLLQTDIDKRPEGARQVRRRIQSIREQQGWGAFELDPEMPLVVSLEEDRMAAIPRGDAEESDEGREGDTLAEQTGGGGTPRRTPTWHMDPAEARAFEQVEELAGFAEATDQTSAEATAQTDEERNPAPGSEARGGVDATEGDEGEPSETDAEPAEADMSTEAVELEVDGIDGGVDGEMDGEEAVLTESMDSGARGGESSLAKLAVEWLPYVDETMEEGKRAAIFGFVAGFVGVWLVLVNIVVVLLLFSPETLTEWLAVR